MTAGMTVKEKLVQARNLIKEKRYDEARVILKQIDHPMATEWLNKIDMLAPAPAAKGTKRSGANSRGESDGVGADVSAAGTVNLGKVVREFGVSGGGLTRRFILGALSILPLFALLSFWPREFKLNTATAMGVGLPLLFVGGMLLMLIPALVAVIANPKITVYSNGLTRSGFSGLQTWTWEQIEGVRGGLTNQKIYGFTLYTTGKYDFFSEGKPVFNISSLTEDVQGAYSLINQFLVKTHAPMLVNRWKRGESLKFMAMEVRPDGLHFGRDHLPLHDIGEVTANKRIIFINRRNGKVWKHFALDVAYNPWVFMEVVNAIVRGA